MDDIDQLLSIKLFGVMDQVGCSEEIRKMYQYTAITHEIINTIASQIQDELFSVYRFGSNCEGTTSVGLDSDIDYVFCDERYPVIDDIHAAPRGQSYLMVRDNHTYPGYVKLQWVYNGTPLTIYNTELPDGAAPYIKYHDTDTDGRICKKHHTWIEPNDHAYERHGPADVTLGKEHIKAKDNVYALRCRTKTMCARKCLEQRRRYHWPSRDNLKKMSDYGCFVVGVGHSSSRRQHIEWRLSFLLQERLLMFTLNPTQYKCYVLLKIINKDIIRTEIGECISSFHCKTCLFHAIEVTPTAIWRPHNLVCCVRLCLMILLKWVVKGVCPNYFIPSENLFEKPQFRDNRCRLLELLRKLLFDDNSIILRLHCDDISDRILKPGILHNNTNGTIVYYQYLHLYHVIYLFSYEMYILNNGPSIRQNVMTLSDHIERLTNTRTIYEHTEQQTSDAISYVIPILHLHIALRLASLVCKGQNKDHARKLLYLSIHNFQHGNDADLMTSRLLVVSLLFRLEKYYLCKTILEDIEHDLKRHVVTKCYCYDRGYVENEDLMQHLSTNNPSFKTAIRTVYVGCVRFTRWDTEISPLSLQYAMSIVARPGSRDECDDKYFGIVAVDGKVHLYFFQYLVQSRLNKSANKQVAIDNLELVIENDHNLRHTETAFNLLGWIHVQEGRIREGLRCFMTSWWIRPVHNAAKWHLSIALFKYYTQ